MKKIKRKDKKILYRRVLFMGTIFSISLFIPFFLYYLVVSELNKQAFVSPIPPNIQKIILGTATQPSTSTKELETLLKKHAVPFSTVSESSESALLIRLETGEEILLSPNKSLEPQISSLQLILSRLTIEGKRFLRLDFRFEKPVIVFK